VYVDLGKFEPDSSPFTDTAALAINERGDTTGYSFVFQGTFNNYSLFVPHTFRKLVAGKLEDFGDLRAIDNVFGSHGWAINNLGVIVGDAVFADIPNPDNSFNVLAPPVMWIGGRVVSLGLFPGGMGGFGNAINDRNQVVGRIDFPDASVRAFLWENGDIKNVPGLQDRMSDASDINNSGHIVGVAACDESNFSHAFLFRDGELIDLGSLLPDNMGVSGAVAINGRDQIIGHSLNVPGAGGAFVWDNGVMHELLSSTGSVNANMYDINDFGDIVGQNTSGRAVLWRQGVLYNLNDLIPPQDPNLYMVLWQARGINNTGQIVGIAELQDSVSSTSQRAFRLDPVTPDVSGDGVVDGLDLARLLSAWGSDDPYIDLDGDGVVNTADLTDLLLHWGPVPERMPYFWTK